MEQALYHPQHGYYGSQVRRIGRAGDFFTAVSVGAVYGELLAEAVEQVWLAAGSPVDFRVAEQAGHDGQLSEDMWRALATKPVGKSVHWVMVEGQAPYRRAQQERLLPLMGNRVEWIDEVADLAGTGVLIANELLDALPVQRVRWSGSEWEECCVTVVGEDLAWTTRPLREVIPGLPSNPPVGWTTELHPAMAAWASSLAGSAWQGAVLVADYGYDVETYYALERSEGTLRRYSNHGSDGNVLADLGEADLTAHINFTLLEQALAAGGWEVQVDLPQGRFLTQVGMDWLRRPGLSRASLRQFQTLTHPGHMGAAFRTMLAARGLTRPLELPTLPALA
jgi:SAM-dependent MidA family methyltransferase